MPLESHTMQLLYPKSIDVLNTTNDMMNTHMLLQNPQVQFNQNHHHQQQQQMFMKYGQTNPHMNPYSLPLLTPQRMHNLSMDVRPRRRRNNHSLVATMDPVAVARRNERERNRVKQVNDGFDALRKRVPFLPDKKKLSKVEILRYAMMYIRDLKGVVEEYDCNNQGNNNNNNINNRDMISKRKDSETSSCSSHESLLLCGNGSSGDEDLLESGLLG